MTNEVIYQRIMRELKVTEKELHSPSHRPALVDARCLISAALMELPLMRQDMVAKMLKTSQGAISKFLSRHKQMLEVDAAYREKWGIILSILA